MKISFKNDYSEGCHPNILAALSKNNLSQQEGYGLDEFSIEATKLILEKCRAPQARVHFVSGGTQANLIVCSALLRPHESVISASTGHIYNNEAGAIEATGHKISTAENSNGKLTPAAVQQILEEHARPPHQLKPKLVYISNSTELGTTYSKQELTALSEFCKEKNLFLFMDGARLGQALMAENADLTLKDIARLTDIFYLGGTKNGALLGEAIIINNTGLQQEFAFIIKQKGGMLSKGRLLGIQFLELMKNDLYFDLAAYANEQAGRLKTAFESIGCDFLIETSTNQIFPILTNKQIDILSDNFEFYNWKKVDEERYAVRIITSWATPTKDIDNFIYAISTI